VHPFFLYEIHRQHMAEWEREAALRRMFLEAPRSKRKRRLRLFLANRLRRHERAQGQALRTDAYACR
jgi:hypothetical protein